MVNRRDFVKAGAASAAALALAGERAYARERIIEKAAVPLKILILGGTGFTGPHQVLFATQRGHQVTVFNRGKRQADLPKSVEHLQGDRNEPNGVDALKGDRKWDVVIDIPTTNPRWVRDAASVLQGRARQYIFISTISTYHSYPKAGMDEDSELWPYEGTDDPFKLTPQQAGAGNLYGPLKVLSEKEAEKWFPGKTTVIRPGLIVGPGDPSDRFTYWPVRIARGGDVLVPGNGKDFVQIIDARDLAEWVIKMAENNTTGIYNATGPKSELTMGEMVAGIRAAFPGDLDAKFTWVDHEFLTKNQIRGWSHMPVWVAPRPNNDGWSRVSIARAVSKGLTFRPLAVTAKDTLEWNKTRPTAEQLIPKADRLAQGPGIPPEKEAELLAAYRSTKASG